MSPRWDWLADEVLKGPDPFAILSAEEQAEGARQWQELVSQRDRLSTRLSWLAEHEGDAEFVKREALVSQSRERFEEMLVQFSCWTGVAPVDLAELLLKAEAGSIHDFCTPVG